MYRATRVEGSEMMRLSTMLGAALILCGIVPLQSTACQLRESGLGRQTAGTVSLPPAVTSTDRLLNTVDQTLGLGGDFVAEAKRARIVSPHATASSLGFLQGLRGGAEHEIARDVKEEEDAENAKHESDTILVPDDCQSFVEAVTAACGEMKRYKSEYHPHPEATEGGKIIEPEIDAYGEVVTEEDHEWVPGNGKKVRLRPGEYAWGTWSERRERFNYPQVMVLQGELDLRGEDGVCCNGQWMMLGGSKGTIRDMMLMTTQHIPGRGGGMCMHFDGGEWLLECCQIRCYPGPLTSVLATSGEAVVALQHCLISRCEGVAIGTWGYGLFAWGNSRFLARDSDFVELKVAVDASFQSQVELEGCHVSHNRIGVLMHDDAVVALRGCEMRQNLRAAFTVGVYGKGRASLSVRDTVLLGNVVWSDDDRPKSFEEHNMTVDVEATELPRCYVDTDFPVVGLPHSNFTLPDQEGLERMRYKNAWAYNWTALRPDPTMEQLDLDRVYPPELRGER